MRVLCMNASSARLMSDVGRDPLAGFANSVYPSKAFSSVGAGEIQGTVQIPAPISTRISPIDVRERAR